MTQYPVWTIEKYTTSWARGAATIAATTPEEAVDMLVTVLIKDRIRDFRDGKIDDLVVDDPNFQYYDSIRIEEWPHHEPGVIRYTAIKVTQQAISKTKQLAPWEIPEYVKVG